MHLAPVRTILLLLVVSSITSANAQDGGQLYGLYCSACHGVDGKGGTSGTFPPLAGSNWIDQDIARTIKTVLHGLHGPIEVNGKPYNLEMPPQRQVLDDQNMAAVLTYVHTAWGNQGKPVRPDQVEAVREETAGRTTPWTAGEILKLHPLKPMETPLENVISRVYKGEWKDLPDFDKLQPESVEEEHDGIIRVSDSPFDEHFGLVWEADFNAPEGGEYTFLLSADDGAKLIVNNQPVAHLKGIGPMHPGRQEEGKITLKKGKNPIRIEYYQGGGTLGISLRWKGSGAEEDWKWLSETLSRKPPAILVYPQGGKAVTYRNFITGTTPRAIGFGFPGALNLAYSPDHLAPELLWTGDFIDASGHWLDRGGNNPPPAGDNLIRLTSRKSLPDTARFKGYTLDAAGNPTFIVQIGEQTLTDLWKPSGDKALERTLILKGEGAALEIPIYEKDLPGNLSISHQNITISPGEKSVVVTYQWR